MKMVRDILSGEAISTGWWVICGAPSSGKTTIIEALKAKGIPTNPDMTRLYIDEEIRRGRTKEQVRANQEEFRRVTFERMVAQLDTLVRSEFMVHDGGLPDCIAYRRLVGVEVGPDVQQACKIFRYRGILLFEPLPYEEDGVRAGCVHDNGSQV